MVGFLISQGVDAHGVDRDGRTPFITACDQGRLGAARLLLEHMGPEALVHVDEEGCTALHSAAFGGHEELVTFLLSKGAYPNGSDVTGMTPFTWACRRGHVGVARLLLPHLGEEDLQEMKNEEGMTPLHEAVSEGHEEMTAFLLSEGVYTDSRNDDGKTPLMLASVRGNTGMVRALVQHLQGRE
jgi:ankyrin repeat protein